MAIYTKNIQPVNEVYFGDTSLEPILKQIGTVRSKHTKIAKDMHSRYINSDPEMLKLNDMFADRFGFRLFSLNIINQKGLNAFTIPISYNYDIYNTSKHVISDKDGYKFSKESEFCCTVSVFSGVFLNKEFTDREVMALILHEIGHNFQSAINNKVETITNVFKVFSGLTMVATTNFVPILLNTNSYNMFMNTFIKELRAKNSKFIQLMDSITNAFGIVGDIFGEVNAILGIVPMSPAKMAVSIYKYLSNKVIRLIANPLNGVKLVVGYKNEQISDNFATMYGYGSDLLSALAKLEFTTTSKVTEAFNKLPIYPAFVNAVNMAPMMIIEAFDEHPVITDRVINQLTMLERELTKEDLDPRMKKEIKRNIDEIKSVKNTYIKQKKSFTDSHKYRKAYLEFLYNMNGSLKYKLNKSGERDNFEQFDKRYEETLK